MIKLNREDFSPINRKAFGKPGYVAGSGAVKEMSYKPILQRGDFVRVKASSDSKAGLDGMVMEQDDGSTVGLIFLSDRHNEVQDCACYGVELWELKELDLETICR